MLDQLWWWKTSSCKDQLSVTSFYREVWLKGVEFLIYSVNIIFFCCWILLFIYFQFLANSVLTVPWTSIKGQSTQFQHKTQVLIYRLKLYFNSASRKSNENFLQKQNSWIVRVLCCKCISTLNKTEQSFSALLHKIWHIAPFFTFCLNLILFFPSHYHLSINTTSLTSSCCSFHCLLLFFMISTLHCWGDFTDLSLFNTFPDFSLLYVF